MKKLIAVMAAACAISAFAETEWLGAEEVDFSTEEAGAWTVPEEGWTQTGTLDEFTLAIEGEENDRYLSIDTPQNGSLAKTIATADDVQAGWNVNVETEVKFTPFDTKPVIDDEAKIAVYYLEQDADENGDGGLTNLMVKAGLLGLDCTVEKTDLALDVENFDKAKFYKLEIISVGEVIKPEAIAQGYPQRLGFKIKIDGSEEVASKESSIVEGAADFIDAKFSADVAANKLFLSMVDNESTLAAVAFRGNGALQKIAIDAEKGEIDVIPPTSEYWEASGVTPTKAAPGAVITMTLTAKEGYLFADGTSEKPGVTGTLESDGTVTIKDEPQTAEVVAENQVTGDKYISLKTALDAVAGVAQEETEIDILADCQYGDDGFKLTKDEILIVVGTIAVDKDGIKLMTEDTTLYVEKEFDAVTSGVEGFEAKFNEEESTWYLEEAEPTEVLPTAKVEKSEAEGYEAVVKFTALAQGSGYDNWAAKFILIPNMAIGEGEIALGGSYAAYEEGKWIDIPFNSCEAGDEISVAGDLNVTVADLFKFVNEFSCGVKNIGLKEDTTFSLKLVIVNPDDEEDVEELCSIDKLTVEKKAAEPTIPEEEGKIEPGENEGEYIVTPADETVTEIDISNLPAESTVEIPAQINTIKGAAGSTVKIVSTVDAVKYDITAACTISNEGVIALNETAGATVKVGDEQIPVQPTLTEAGDKTAEPLVVSTESTAVGVKAIPGLKYSLVRSETIGGEQNAVASQTATSARVTLTDEFKGGKPASAFYVIQVAK